MGTIKISRLTLHTRIGVEAAERATVQRIDVSLELGVVDPTTDTVTLDYAILATHIEKIAATEHHTIEGFALDILDLLKREYAVTRYRIEVRKFILPNCESVAFILES